MDVRLDALGPSGPYASRKRQVIKDVAGAALGAMSQVPRLFVSRTMTALRKASPMPLGDRLAAIAEAGRAFSEDRVGGLSVADYQWAVSRVSGLPLSTTTAALERTATTAAHIDDAAWRAQPTAAVNDWRDKAARHGTAVWARRGDVFAVHAPGNTPSIHTLWLTALALGYRVAVRPSAREPFSPHRMITALREAGFGKDQVALLPTNHEVADSVVRSADLAMAYGGDAVLEKYAGMATLLPQGPGRSKFLITGDWQPYLDTIVSSVSEHGGTGCINTTAVYVTGDPGPLAEALAERLARLPSLPPEHPDAVLPVQRVDGARALEKYLLAKGVGARALLGGDGIVEELGDGSAVLRPSVHQVKRADAPQTRIELPFPCVWVAPWSPSDGIAALRDTLVLTAATDDEALIDSLLAEPSIANLYIGDHPTHWMAPGIPHDDYLESFLMRTKAVIR
jgi:acyl-CoA reductase-like NAD-dependent aldehyde dehydrogenase